RSRKVRHRALLAPAQVDADWAAGCRPRIGARRRITLPRRETMLKVGIVVGSTRPGRKAEAVARWVHEIARKRTDADFEVVDIQDFDLPLLDEPVPPSLGQYSKPHTKAWAAMVDSFDAFVFVTPEYNHGTSGALKNAIDFLF